MPQFDGKPRIAGIATAPIMRLKGLQALFPEFDAFKRLYPGVARGLTATVGWGNKPTACSAQRVARKRNIPYVAVEDGFLRSWGPARLGYAPHSLVVDYTGIYYDSQRPSDLETSIRDDTFSELERSRAASCMARLSHYRLSKYNDAPDRPLPSSERTRVLVVDQTLGDASIAGGRADSASFHRMLEDALSENPRAEIIVKTHPDVIAGEKRGHLTTAGHNSRCRLIAEPLNPWALFEAVEKVYVVTSQIGFEALIAGKDVVCHGMPFYAGWGLTMDRLSEPRRDRARDLETVFAAAYLRYCRYANPYTAQASTLEETIDLIADQAYQQERLTGKWIAAGFSWHKRRFIGDFLGTRSRVRYTASIPEGHYHGSPDERLVTWGGPQARKTDQPARRHWHMEDGFLRSVGLGVDLVQPLSVVLDSRGIYYDPSVPSDLEVMLNEARFDDWTLERARALSSSLIQRGLSKYNVDGAELGELPSDRRIVLVPGQVESDASIRRGTGTIQTNGQLLEAVRQAQPDAFIIYKPHPDVCAGSRPGCLDKNTPLRQDLTYTGNIHPVLARTEEVHTMTSLAGFEGLLRGCHVVTYGLPFYAGWGLTEDHAEAPGRFTRRTLEELVAAALIHYPVYRDPRSRQLCNAETTVALLEQQRVCASKLSPVSRMYRLYRQIAATDRV